MSEASETRLSALDDVLDQAYARSRDDEGVISRIVGVVTRAPSASDLAAHPSELFAVVDAVHSSVALRRALTDPGAAEKQRQQLVHNLLDGKVSKTAAGIVADGVVIRWPGGRTLTAALERQAVRAQLLDAERAGVLEETEDELFRFARLVESTPSLRNALADRAAPLQQRQDLVGELLTGRATEATVALAKRAVGARERTFVHTVEGFVALAAEQRNRLVATVRVAQPLTAEQRDRLRTVLQRQTGRDVTVQEVVDESVVGGARVELGDEVIEGTVAARLESARRMFE